MVTILVELAPTAAEPRDERSGPPNTQSPRHFHQRRVDADREIFLFFGSFLHGLIQQRKFYFEFPASDTVSFVPTYLGSVNCSIYQADSGNPFQLRHPPVPWRLRSLARSRTPRPMAIG